MEQLEAEQEMLKAQLHGSNSKCSNSNGSNSTNDSICSNGGCNDSNCSNGSNDDSTATAPCSAEKADESARRSLPPNLLENDPSNEQLKTEVGKP